MKSRIATGLIAVVCLLGSYAFADEIKEVAATGSAQVVKGNKEGAREAALEDAKRNAVEQVGSEVISETVVENFELVKDVVVTKIAGYVKDYKATSQSCDSSYCKVSIDARVSARKLKDDATLIYKDMDKPRVMVLVPETSPSGEVEIKSSLAENTIMQYFNEKEFELVDRNQALSNIEADKIKAAASGDQKTATMLGARAGAEVIVVGTANTGVPESIRNILYASTPTISVRAINTGNASVYATATKVGKGQGGTPDQAQKTALQDTASQVGREIFWKIVQEWNKEKLNGVPVELVASGVDFQKLMKLKKDLASLDEVKDVVQRDFAAPSATLTVYIIGDSNRLAELVSGHGIAEVTGLSAGRVTVKVK